MSGEYQKNSEIIAKFAESRLQDPGSGLRVDPHNTESVCLPMGAHRDWRLIAVCLLGTAAVAPCGHLKVFRCARTWFLWSAVSGWSRADEEGLIRFLTPAADRLRRTMASGAGMPPSFDRLSRSKNWWSEVLYEIAQAVSISEMPSVGTWLTTASPSRPDPRDVISHPKGMQDFTGAWRRDPSPQFYGLATLPVVPVDGPAPHFNRFLEQITGGDGALKETLIMWMGLCLVADVRYQKMLVLVGPPRSGKGTYGKILGALLGPACESKSGIHSLASQFSMQQLLNAGLVFFSDVIWSAGFDHGTAVENLLSLTAGDKMQVNVKYGGTFSSTLASRIMIASNSTPHRFPGSAAALQSRIVIVEMQESFVGREDYDLDKRIIEDELPQVAGLAIKGLQMLRERRRFDQPRSEIGQSILDALVEGQKSMEEKFFEDMCEFDPSYKVSMGDLHRAYVHWCEGQGEEKPRNASHFGRWISANMRWQGVKMGGRTHVAGVKIRYVTGVRLQRH